MVARAQLRKPWNIGDVRGRYKPHISSRRDAYRFMPYNILMPIPREIQGQKYISLSTFRKSGAAVATPVWFAEQDGKLYVMTRSDSGKYKRIRNNPQVRIAPCTMRGKITGPEFPATARILPPEDWPRARKLLASKYWLMKVPFLWSKKNEFIELQL